MNYSALPYLFAIGVLIAVFRSVRARNLDSLSRYWLSGWIFILVHFCAQLLEIGGGPREEIAHAVSLTMLMAAGAAFIAASYTGNISPRKQAFYSLLVNGFNTAFLVCYAFHMQSIRHYLSLSIAALVFGLIGLYAINRYSPIPRGLILLFVVKRLLQIVILYTCPIAYVSYWILFGTYLFAALLLRNRQSDQRTSGKNEMGMRVVILSFFAWAAVYLAEPLLMHSAPGTPLDSELRNLPKFLVAVGMILVLLEQQVNHHEHLALHDELTGLPNRRLFEDRLQQAIDRAQRTGKRVALLTIDLNHFKNVNDAFGHPAGDHFLKAITARFQLVIRRADTIARTGGDEFSAVICDLPNRESTHIVIHSLRHSIIEPVMIQGIAVPISLSIGMALYPEDGNNIGTLISAADADMYRWKHQMRGPNRNRKPSDVEHEKVVRLPQTLPGA